MNLIRRGDDAFNERWLLDNVIREVCDEISTLFWKDPWLGGSSFDVRFSRLFELVDNKLKTVWKCIFWGGVLVGRRGSGAGGCLLGRRSC